MTLTYDIEVWYQATYTLIWNMISYTNIIWYWVFILQYILTLISYYLSNWNKKYNHHNWYNSTHSVLLCAFTPIGVHYISRDQPKAHELTNHILHPSPESSRRSLQRSPGSLHAAGQGQPDTPSKRLHRLCGMIAVNPLNSVVFGVTQHQTVGQSNMTLVFGWFLEFQCPEESCDLNHNTYNTYNMYNTKKKKINLWFFSLNNYWSLWESNMSQQTP